MPLVEAPRRLCSLHVFGGSAEGMRGQPNRRGNEEGMTSLHLFSEEWAVLVRNLSVRSVVYLFVKERQREWLRVQWMCVNSKLVFGRTIFLFVSSFRVGFLKW
mmetsp:Transcript_29116/g.57068  ORF Transcript_29116/g.57068 Transcript_29116/m.57068 type:complete len:103 (+) Transcript_29116:46-354(+)